MNDIEICILFIKDEVNKKQLVQKSIEKFWKRFEQDKNEKSDKYGKFFESDTSPLIKIEENQYRSIVLVTGAGEKANYLYIRFEIYSVKEITKYKKDNRKNNEDKHIGIYRSYFYLDGAFMKDELEVWFDM